jgi:hypothetical protein
MIGPIGYVARLEAEITRLRNENSELANRIVAATPPWPADTPEGREEVARMIYNSFPYDGPLGKQKPDWIPNGNSFMQDKARETAGTLISALRPAAAPPGTVKMYAVALDAANVRIAELEARLGEQQSRSFDMTAQWKIFETAMMMLGDVPGETLLERLSKLQGWYMDMQIMVGDLKHKLEVAEAVNRLSVPRPDGNGGAR